MHGITFDEILSWLREEDPQRLEELWAAADSAREKHVGNAVHLRGLIEISSHCCRYCAYCGLRSDNRSLDRYRMTAEEILECARQAKQFGYGTVVMQAGEDFGITQDWMSDIIRSIKVETGLAVTLSLGERSDEDLCAWKEAGANRYLLRFESSDPELYRRIHPCRAGQALSDRIAMLQRLRAFGYEIGSGVMVGIPGQTHAMLATDIDTFRRLDLDMIGIGPFIVHPATPLGRSLAGTAIPEETALFSLAEADQVPNTELMTYKAVALARLVCPQANIPSTTALATLNLAQGRELGLQRGANIVMPNLTPPQYRQLYEIYPDKACVQESAGDCHGCMKARIRSIGREPGAGPGGRTGRPE